MTYVLRVLRARGLTASPSTLMPSDLHSWQIGIAGEQLIGQELALLPDGWQVLHAIPAGSNGADIDHLVIGPGGVFVLNTKHHAERSVKVGTHAVWVNGHQQNGYQSELLKRRDQVARSLELNPEQATAVHPLLVFVRPTQILLAGQQTVFSVASSALVTWLLTRPRVFEEDLVARLAARAAVPATWGALPSAAIEPDPTMEYMSLPGFIPMRTSRSPRPAMRPPQRVAAAPRRQTAGGRRVVIALAAIGISLVALPAVLTVAGLLLGAVVRALAGL